MGGRLLAAVDVGTSSVRLALFDEGLSLVELVRVRSPLRQEGFLVEQDAEWIAATVRGLLDRAVDAGAAVVGLSVYRGSVVAWRPGGGAVTGVVTWMDRRGLCLRRLLPLPARLAARIPGVGAAFSPESPAVRLAVTLRLDPGLARAVGEGRVRVWSLEAFLAERLFGEPATSPDLAALTGLVHPGSLEPLGAVYRLLGIPRTVEPPRLVWHDEAPWEWRGVPVGPLVGDQQAASHGLGCLGGECWRLTLGTGFFLDAPTGGRLVAAPGRGMIPVILHATRRGRVYGVEAYAPGLGKAAEWLVERLLNGDYSLLDPHGGPAPLVAPYAWGLRRPRLHGAWGVAGLEPPDPGALGRGLARSLAAAALHLYETAASRLPRPRLLAVGGGLARARRLLAALAAAAGVEAAASLDGQDSARGAALLAAGAAGVPAARPEPVAVEADPAPLPGHQAIERLARALEAAVDPCGWGAPTRPSRP